MRSTPIKDTTSGVVACEEAVHSNISKKNEQLLYSGYFPRGKIFAKADYSCIA